MSKNSCSKPHSTSRRNRSSQVRGSSFRPLVELLESRRLLAGQPIEVNTFDDVTDDADGLTSFREAIEDAASRPGDDTIQLDNGTYVLDLGQLVIDDPSGKLTIEAPNAAVLDAQGKSRVMDVKDSNLLFDNLTITGGVAEKGAGIHVTSSQLMVNNSEFRGNSAEAFGGGIAIQNDSDITLNSTLFEDNTARGGAGIATLFQGISSTAGTLMINDSEFTNNRVSRMGGAIALGEGVSAVLNRTIVSDNSAGWAGGAIVIGSMAFPNAPSSVEINSSQIHRNSGGSGGGFMLGTGVNRLVLNDSDVTNNRATTLASPMGGGAGGGILMLPQGSNRVELSGSEISGNSAVGSGGGVQMNGTLTVGSESHISDNSARVLQGDSQNSNLHVASNAEISTNAFAGSLSAIRSVSVEGKLVAKLDSASKPINAVSRLKLEPGSVLRLEATANLGSPGDHRLQVAGSRRIQGTFDSTPEVGEHVGAGVFVAEHAGTGSTVEYAKDEIWVNLFQATAGDANGDGSVDFEDFLKLSANFGMQQASWVDGDFDGDGKVAFADFLLLWAQFGSGDPQSETETMDVAALDQTFGQL